MAIAKEGIREIIGGTVILGLLGAGAAWLWWPLAIPFVLVWLWVIAFFRDPPRRRAFAAGELGAPADGRVTEISWLDHYEPLGGPAVRIGIFLSIFNVHANRAPCAGTVRTVTYRRGSFLDARHVDSGKQNESNTLLIDPDHPIPGPVEVRQVAGKVARRIVCHAAPGDAMEIGQRFGMIKFGSRTELIVPQAARPDVQIQIGDSVRAGLTVMVRVDTTAGS